MNNFLPKKLLKLQRMLYQKQYVLLVIILTIGLNSFAQELMREHVITGVVSDAEGVTLSGATVVIGGSTKGVMTDGKGHYKIEASSTDKLTFSYIGMESETLIVGGKTVIDVFLKAKKGDLEEVTVVAFATQKKESVVGSITTIKPSELKVPSSNLTTALAGRVAGMIAYQRSGEPGADNADFFIRGVTSFGYSKKPLILVDGVEMSAYELARLQVDDIATFSIMKDATATSLYGARGANGVIIISTKEGKEGKAQISLRFENSTSQPTEKVSLADPITYMLLANESVVTRDRKGLRLYSQEKIENTAAGRDPLLYPSTDWYNMLLSDKAVNSRLNMSASGGGQAARYYVGATYNNDNGLLKVDQRNNFNNNINLKTFGLRSNVNINLSKTTEALVRLNTTWTDYNGPLSTGAAVYNQVMTSNPVLFPAFYPPDAKNMTTEHILFGNAGSGQYSNPYANLMRGYRDYTRSMFLAQFELKQDLSFITKGLKASGMFNTTRNNYYSVSRAYKPFYYSIGNYDKTTGNYALSALNPAGGQEFLDYAEAPKDISTETYLQGILSYNRDINPNNAISAMMVFTMMNKLAANSGTLQNSLPSRNLGLAGRLTYAFKERYFLEANFGYNGSERFYQTHRYGFFPSIGGAWTVSKEKFWNEGLRNVISNLKLRATYGLVGNDAIGSIDERFFFLSEVDMNNAGRGYTFGSEFGNTIPGILESRYENRDITWEKASKTNISAEVGLFNSVNIVAEVFKEYRTSILMTRANIPNTMGLVTLPKTNVGEVSAQGMDLSLEFNKNLSKDWFISGRGNFTYATSKIEKYAEPDYSTTPWVSRVGYSVGQTWGYVAERLFVDDAEVLNSPSQAGNVMGGDIKYKDINDDGRIDGLDQVPIGFPTSPKIVYGLGFSAAHRGIDISCFVQGVAKESFWIDPGATAPFIGNKQLLKAYADNHWSEDNRDLYALWPRLSSTTNTNNTEVSTWFMRSGAFLRLKQVEFGYTLPAKLTKKISMEKIRIYGNGTNLLTLSQFKLWDPEMAGFGLGYPLQKVFNLGIQCSL